jgi:hypothetical protein
LSRGILRISKLHAQERGGFAPIASLLEEPSSGGKQMDVKRFSFFLSLRFCSAEQESAPCAPRESYFSAGWQ